MFRILVVDDDKSICRSLAIQLEQEGHDVETAHTVADGLAALENTDFDVAFIDLMLPDDKGLAILKSIRESGSDCKGIMITGAQDMQATIEAMQSGAFDYIRKPLDIESLFATLEKVKQLTTPSSARPLSQAASRANIRRWARIPSGPLRAHRQ